jgi:hypothetical protein
MQEEEEPTPSTVLKVRIPKPGALTEKQQDPKIPPVKLGDIGKPESGKKSKHRKGSGSKKKKRGGAEEGKEDEGKDSFKFKVSNGKVVPYVGCFFFAFFF